MKSTSQCTPKQLKQYLAARFGRIRLLRDRSGIGVLADCDKPTPTEVKEWIAMFGDDIVLGPPKRAAGH